MIYPVDFPEGGYVISAYGVWLPGVYASERAARYAFRFSTEELRRIHDSRGNGLNYQPITVECLHEWRYGPRRPGRDGRI